MANKWDPRTVFDELSTPAFLVNVACTIVAANAALAALFASTQDDIVGCQLVEVWSARDYDRVHQAAISLFSRPGERVIVEHVRVPDSGDAAALATVIASGVESPDEPLVLCEFIVERAG